MKQTHVKNVEHFRKRLGSKIRKARNRSMLSQADVARCLNLNVEGCVVSQWEAGRVTPRLEHMVALSRLFDCLIDELLP